MDILILGGTMFLGRALVEAAQARGHRVTLFNRGRTNPELYPEVEKLHGDRKTDLSLLSGRRWDAVIDTSGYQPGDVRASTGLLANAVEQYIFISSISVFADFREIGMDENAPLAQLPEGTDPDAPVTGETYGALKALCEQAAEESMPGRVLVIRPGLIVGPHDPTDRFTYWPCRVAQGGEVLAPDKPQLPTQFIDARDLAEWTVRMVENRQLGIYNATGPAAPLPMGDLLEACRQASSSDAHFTWVNEAFLLKNQVQPWSQLPLWLPESSPEYAGMQQVSIRKALAAGLTFRPLEDTIRDTLAWASNRPKDHTWRAGLSREQETALLQKFRQEGQI